MGKRSKEKKRLSELYEAEDSDPAEEKGRNKRFDSVANYQYELPDEFEDEEIDEEMAFNAEDEQQYAHIFQNSQSEIQNNKLNEQTATITRDDFSEDDSEADRLYGPAREAERTLGESKEADSDVENLFAGYSEELDSDSDGESHDKSHDKHGFDGQVESRTVAETVQQILGSKEKKKAKAEILDEVVPESEYNLPVGEADADLSLADFLAGIENDKHLSKARKQLKTLLKKAEPVSPLLPGPIRARQERLAGYEATNKDLSKWVPIVRANREAPTLVLTRPLDQVAQTRSTAVLTSKFRPNSNMELEVAALLHAVETETGEALREAGSDQPLQAEDVESVAKRQNEMAKLRALMFKHQRKARHLAKIKSKEYHRRLKKSARLKAEKAGVTRDKDFLRLEAERAEYERAKERLTLKHRNTGQWARRALKRGINLGDDGTKEAIAEQLRLGRELRRKVERKVEAAESDSDASDGNVEASSSSEEDDQEDSRRKLRAAASDILAGSEGDEEGVSSSLLALPFMKRAQEKRKLAAQEEAKQLLAELDGLSGEEHEEAPPQGRQNFGLSDGTRVRQTILEDSELSGSGSDENEDVEAKHARLRAVQQSQQPSDRAAGGAIGTSIEKPPAEGADGDFSGGRALGQALVASRSGARSPHLDLALKVTEQRGNLHLLIPKQAGESSVRPAFASQNISGKRRQEVSIGPSAAEPQQPPKPDAELKSFLPSKNFTGAKAGYVFKSGKSGVGYYMESKQTDSEDNLESGQEQNGSEGQPDVDLDQSIAARAVDGFSAEELDGSLPEGELSQRELIARAFAGDNVAAEFEAQKEAEVAAELPEVEAPSLLPGWGTWASQQREPKWMLDARTKAERQKQAARRGRKDAQLDAVILSERWDKKSAKFSAPSLPYPYTSKEAFEGSMRQPLGADFNSQKSARYSGGAAEFSRSVVKMKNQDRPKAAVLSGGRLRPAKKQKSR